MLYIPMGVCVDKYQQLRAKKKQITERQAEELKPINEAMDLLEAHMLSQLNEQNANSMRTENGMAYRSVRQSFTIDDPAAFRAWTEANERPDFYENRVSKDAVANYIEAGHDLPPGLKMSTFTQINVRK